jgi:hypothetical protein
MQPSSTARSGSFFSQPLLILPAAQEGRLAVSGVLPQARRPPPSCNWRDFSFTFHLHKPSEARLTPVNRREWDCFCETEEGQNREARTPRTLRH